MTMTPERCDQPSRLLQRSAQYALRLLFPAQCRTCEGRLTDDPNPFFCRICWQYIRPLKGPACPRCARPFASTLASVYSPGHLCGDCRQRKPAFTRAWSVYPYASPLREAISLLKYEKKYALADSLCRLLLSALPPALNIDVTMPVPLHPTRLREREFNQSLLLAQAVSRRLGTALSYTNLIRVTNHAPQTSLSRSARLKNLRHAFRLRTPEMVRNCRVLLVDDVFTTGTTLHECAKALRKAGGGDVYALTLARAVDPAMLPHIPRPVSVREIVPTKGTQSDAYL